MRGREHATPRRLRRRDAHDQLPFGGAKQSGFGKEHGIEALDSYIEKKSVVIAT
ncbi:MAG: aldehyde dehydrogenase family protein [Chloroflexi bacterium]|nr:aldehyde dehydrogenase family protein [Chloroflexota bacterium]